MEVVNARVTALGILPPLALWEPPAGYRGAHGRGARRAYFDERWVDAPVLARGDLSAEGAVAGPVIVEDEDATTIVPSGWTVSPEAAGSLRLSRGGA
jgi:N-methylhydantoinase A/oxoprolinase/acetone carboxylase beta subunit